MSKLPVKGTMLFAVSFYFFYSCRIYTWAQVLLPSADKKNIDIGYISAHLNAGMLTGTANEYVYSGDYTLSRLIWEIDNLYMAGGGFSLNKNGLISMQADLWLKVMDGGGSDG